MSQSIHQTVSIYTDGACSGNPGPGGWGALLMYGEHEKEIFGGECNTTNNKMELTAVIKALETLKKPCNVELWTDSKYVKDGMTSWIHNWKKNGWKTSSKKPVKNVDLWQRLSSLSSMHNISWNWIKGHSGHKYNDKADALAQKGILECNR